VAIVFIVCCDTLYPTVETVDDTSPVIDAKASMTGEVRIAIFGLCDLFGLSVSQSFCLSFRLSAEVISFR